MCDVCQQINDEERLLPVDPELKKWYQRDLAADRVADALACLPPGDDEAEFLAELYPVVPVAAYEDLLIVLAKIQQLAAKSRAAVCVEIRDLITDVLENAEPVKKDAA